MHLYYGKSIEEIDISSENIEFSDELIEYIYLNRNKISINLDSLFNIDPYDDQLINSEQVQDINLILKELLTTNLFEIEELYLKEIKAGYIFTKKAIEKNLTIISIGD